MKLNRTGSNWNRLERNKINENWDIIEGSYNDVVGQITDEVVGHLIDSSRLDWKEPVDTVGDLPANAEVGETRMVREADPDGISYVYRYDGEKWEKIQAIDVTLVNEVDRRLTRQLADISVNVKNFGAVGDGIINDTESILAALDYVKREGKGTLYFPNGIYIIDFVIKIDFDVKITGESKHNTVIKVKDQSTLFHNPSRDNNDDTKTDVENLFRDYHAVFFIHDCNFEMHNIKLDGNPANQFELINDKKWNYVAPNIGGGLVDYYKYFHGIQTKYDTLENPKLVISNCHITGFSWNNICINNRGNINVFGDSIEIRNNIIENAAQDLLSIHKIENFEGVVGNHFINPNSHGLHVYYNVKKIKVSLNNFDINNDFFNFYPNIPTNTKTFIVLGHSDYLDNFIKDVDISFNTLSNRDFNISRVIGISCRMTLSGIQINENNFYETNVGISFREVLTGINNIKNNNIIFKEDGIVFRPFEDGTIKELNPIITKPYKTEISIINNFIKPFSSESRNAVDFRSMGGTVEKTLLEEYKISLHNNDLNKVYFEQTDIFKLINNDLNMTVGDGKSALSFDKYEVITDPEQKVKLFSIIKAESNTSIQFIVTMIRQGDAASVYDCRVGFNPLTVYSTKRGGEGIDALTFLIEESNNMFHVFAKSASTQGILFNVKASARYHTLYTG